MECSKAGSLCYRASDVKWWNLRRLLVYSQRILPDSHKDVKSNMEADSKWLLIRLQITY